MARRGEPGLALGIGVWSSFCGGIISAILLVLFAPQLATVGLEFHPWDFFMLVMFALTVTASLAGENLVKGLIAGAAGLLIRTVGEDDAVGVGRFDFGSDYLLTGFDFIAVLIGLFAFSQLLSDLRDPVAARKALSDRKRIKVKIEHRRAIAILLKHWVVVIGLRSLACSQVFYQVLAVQLPIFCHMIRPKKRPRMIANLKRRPSHHRTRGVKQCG